MDIKQIYQEVINSEEFCDQCKYSEFYSQEHPYGETTTTERLWQCTVEDTKDCPGVIEYLE